MTLEDLAKKYGTDKYIHRYCSHYEAVLLPLKNENIRLLEIGVDRGWSMRMWRDFFPRAELVGVDVVINKHDLKESEADIKSVDFDNQDEVKNFAKSSGNFDVIIDDGGHSMRQQQYALNFLWDLVKPGGYFIMEDMHTSLYNYYPKRNIDRDPTTLDLIRSLESGGEFESRFISREKFNRIKSELSYARVIQTCDGTPEKHIPSITSIIKKL
jgi:hypothetical protein